METPWSICIVIGSQRFRFWPTDQKVVSLNPSTTKPQLLDPLCSRNINMPVYAKEIISLYWSVSINAVSPFPCYMNARTLLRLGEYGEYIKVICFEGLMANNVIGWTWPNFRHIISTLFPHYFLFQAILWYAVEAECLLNSQTEEGIQTQMTSTQKQWIIFVLQAELTERFHLYHWAKGKKKDWNKI